MQQSDYQQNLSEITEDRLPQTNSKVLSENPSQSKKFFIMVTYQSRTKGKIKSFLETEKEVTSLRKLLKDALQGKNKDKTSIQQEMIEMNLRSARGNPRMSDPQEAW